MRECHASTVGPHVRVRNTQTGGGFASITAGEQMRGQRLSATERGARMGIVVSDGGVPRAVFGVWKDRARGDRQEARSLGARGTTRNMNARVTGERGKRVPADHFAAAMEAARTGIPMESSFGRAVQALSMTYTLAYERVAREQTGPKAS